MVSALIIYLSGIERVISVFLLHLIQYTSHVLMLLDFQL